MKVLSDFMLDRFAFDFDSFSSSEPVSPPISAEKSTSSVRPDSNMMHHPQMRNMWKRYTTFTIKDHDYSWKLKQATEMSEAGFFYQPIKNHESRVVCYQCGKAFDDWNSQHASRPAKRHLELSPDCPHILKICRQKNSSEHPKLKDHNNWFLTWRSHLLKKGVGKKQPSKSEILMKKKERASLVRDYLLYSLQEKKES